MTTLNLIGLLMAAFLICCHEAVEDKDFQALKRQVEEMTKTTNEKLEKIQDTLQKSVQSLAKQLSLQQLYVEEQGRSSGDSGIKVTRLYKTGTRSYFSDSYTNGFRVMSNHDHADFRDTVGLGELAAVLNGVEFRTRHNDYRLVMPHRSKKDYGLTQTIPTPAVPPEVLNKKTIPEQAAEMREWFKAWKNQDSSKRDYSKYFKPVLCYLEGMWTITDMNKIEEPFASDRHSLDAASFFALQDSIKFSTSTGRKSTKENFAFLPTTVSSVKDGVPEMAQWNYKILCHPLKQEVPLDRFQLEDDLGNRLARGRPNLYIHTDRQARFSLYHPLPKNDSKHDMTMRPGYDKEREGKFLDLLMGEIPGKDNYPAQIIDDAWGEVAYPVSSKVTYDTRNDTQQFPPLNAGYYHKAYRSVSGDAMGSSNRKRGYNDASLYVALTTSEKILGHTTSKCKRDWSCSNRNSNLGKCKKYQCSYWTQRVSYAIPLEIIYMTPLMSWNPYNFTYHDDQNVLNPQKLDIKNGKQRNGALTKEMAYNGVSRKKFYVTPADFYTGEQKREDSADTSFKSVGVLDQQGNVRQVRSSGISILTSEIDGIGRTRIRYPIMPTYEQGSTVKKELDALKELVMNSHKLQDFFPVEMNNGTVEAIYTFVMPRANKDPPGPHDHLVQLSETQLRTLKYDKKRVTVVSESGAGHDHELLLQYGEPKINPGGVGWVYPVQCDGVMWKPCWDGHEGGLICVDCIGKAFPV